MLLHPDASQHRWLGWSLARSDSGFGELDAPIQEGAYHCNFTVESDRGWNASGAKVPVFENVAAGDFIEVVLARKVIAEIPEHGAVPAKGVQLLIHSEMIQISIDRGDERYRPFLVGARRHWPSVFSRCALKFKNLATAGFQHFCGPHPDREILNLNPRVRFR
jgi:hypothetical protein